MFTDRDADYTRQRDELNAKAAGKAKAVIGRAVNALFDPEREKAQPPHVTRAL